MRTIKTRIRQGLTSAMSDALLAAGPEPVAPMRSTYCYLGGHRALATTARGDKIFLDTEDVGLTPHIALSGVWEAHVEALLRRLLRQGATVVEVGANMGYHTLVMAAAIGEQGRLHAFEVNPRMLALLRQTIAVNGLDGRVTLHACAAMDVPGTISFAVHPQHAGSGYVVTGDAASDYTDRIQAPAARIDDLLHDIPAANLMRLDCEGSEPPALRGAEALIRRSPDLVIVTEWAAGMMAMHGDVAAHAAWLRGLGFAHCSEIDGHGALHAREPDTLADLVLADLVFSRAPLPA